MLWSELYLAAAMVAFLEATFLVIFALLWFPWELKRNEIDFFFKSTWKTYLSLFGTEVKKKSKSP